MWHLNGKEEFGIIIHFGYGALAPDFLQVAKGILE
jgi:hypothetical protein